MSAIYLDYNATTPPHPKVVEKVREVMAEAWGNPSSGYSRGVKAKIVVETARKQVGDLLGAGNPDQEITFTSGGTEANMMAIKSSLDNFIKWQKKEGIVKGKPHIITSNIEHVAIDLPLRKLQKDGEAEITFIEVDKRTGRVNPEDIIGAISSSTCLVTVMFANNETGVIQPLKEIIEGVMEANIIRKDGNEFPILVHTDAAQPLGKVKFNVQQCPADLVSICGHKFYATRIGALYHREGIKISPTFLGGGQEKGRRSGTENTPMIAGFGEACRLIHEGEVPDENHYLNIRNNLEEELKKSFGSAFRPNFTHPHRLPNTLSVSFEGGIYGSDILKATSGRIEASTTSACHTCTSGNIKPPPVLINSGVPVDHALSTIRLSVGRHTTLNDVKEAAKVLYDAYINVKLSGDE